MVPDAPNWFLSVCFFVGFILCMIPLPWHLEAWNMGTCLYMLWTGFSCLNLFINSIVWNSDVINRAPVFCDISTKLSIGASVAIPAASLCINRRLYQIVSVQSVIQTRGQKRREVLTDLAIGLGIPLIVMILHVVVQSNRFVIIEEVGCSPFIMNTALSYVLIFAWPIGIGLVSAFYCVRTIRELVIRRMQFREFLSANKSLSSGRYLRLMALAGADALFTVPLGCYVVALNLTTGPLFPYVSWNHAHSGFSTIIQIPSAVWRQNRTDVVATELSRYLTIFCAFLFFAFFGFADEARTNYHLAYTSVAKRLRLSTGSFSTTGIRTGTKSDTSFNNTMPVFVTHQTETKRHSLTSFSSQMSLPDYGGALVEEKMASFSPTATSSGSTSKESLPKSHVDSGSDSMPLPPPPEPSLDMSAPPRYGTNASHSV